MMSAAVPAGGSPGFAGMLLLLAVGLVLCLVLACVVLRSARRRAAGPDAPAKPGALLGKAAASLQTALDISFSAVREWVPGVRSRYAEPLFLMTGEPGSGKTSLLRSAAPQQSVEDEKGMLNWYRLSQGWILEAHGAFLGIDDEDGGAGGWLALAGRLQASRPRRPLDGIVLTVAADALLGPAAWTRPELERRAGLVQQRLAAMQSATGLRLPVYLLVTRADRLSGFSSFAATLPDGLRQAMLGWSNPYDIEAPFERSWTGAAFGALRMAVCGLQAELLAAGRPVPDTDTFFQLGPQIEMLAEPAGAYIARLMGASANGERPLLRGVYLCGDPAGEAQPLFVRDVLASKVFPERWLARPLRGQGLLRDRKAQRWALACAVLVLVWGFALARAAHDLRGKSDALLAALVKVDSAQRDRVNLRKEQGNLPYSWYQGAAQHLMDTLMRQDGGGMAFASIPASWSWPGRQGLEQRIDQGFTRGLENIVLRAVAKGLNLRAVALSGAEHDPVTTELADESTCTLAGPASAAPTAPNQALTDGAAFGELSAFVDQTLVFEQWRRRFDKLQEKEDGSLADLAGLGSYTRAFDIGAGAHAERRRYLVDALRAASISEPLAAEKTYAPGLACAFRLRSELFLAQALDQHPALRLANAIDQQLAAAGAGAADVHAFDDLLHQLHELSLWLNGPGMRWVEGSGDDFGKRYAGLLDKVGGSRMLGKTAAEQLRQDTKSRVAQLQLRLLDSGAGGRILQRSKEGGKFELVPAVAQVEAALGALLQQRFMQPPPAVALEARDEADGPPAAWSLDALNRALQLAGEQRAYMGQVLGSFPPQFQAGLQAVADQRLAANLVAAVARARVPASDPREAYQSLAQAQKVLTSLIDALGSPDSAAQRARLSAMAGGEAEAGLRWLQKEFAAASPYQPREGGFGWWQGSANPAAQGFGGGQAEGLEEYLAQQHELVASHAALAQPLLRLQGAREGGANAGVARYWRSLVAEQDRFQAKHPDGRMARLDAYIRGELAAADLDSCGKRNGAGFPAASTDFFSQRGRALAGQLAARCQELAGAGAAGAYEQLRTAFLPLAGRFPFAPAAEGQAADIAQVADFFGSYDKLGAAVTRQPPNERAREFVAWAQRARSFLAPLLAAADGTDAPGYDLSVRFRVNERGEPDGDNQLGGEVQGNRIAGWSLQSGERSVGWQAGKAAAAQTLPWRLGMPLVLTLRWAENAPAIPYADSKDPRMSVHGRDVVYRISEPWALLRLVSAYRMPPGAAPGQAARFETLRFEIPTAPREAGMASGAPRAIVFVRLAMSPSARKDLLAFPQFPVEAPLAGTQIVSMKP